MSRSKGAANRARRWLGFSALTAVLVGGCNVIFGIEQHEPFPAGGGGSGGSSGTGGGAGDAPCSSPDDCSGADTTCEYRTCDAGACGVAQATADTPCNEDGGQVCDGEGSCVECNTADQCDAGDSCEQHLCVNLACSNDTQDGSETDVDCGGGDCPPCANGLECLVYSDCQSRFCDTGGGTGGSGGSAGGVCAPCVADGDCAPITDAWCDTNTNGGECADQLADGSPCTVANECLSGNCPSGDSVCCDTACERQCEACVGTKTGGADGACAPVTAGSDPDTECADAPGACGPDGTGCNGDANDPHCNGANCTCLQQYSHNAITQSCSQSSTECQFRIDATVASCAAVCEAGGGECVAYHNDNNNNPCTLGQQYPCTHTQFTSATCICSRGCDGDAACVTPFVCTNGDCL
ncbi:MAG: hypothetical protein JRI68_10300 [Deltaproteobacteria bacterium]|nr:hypothetical protein [Deltaproteobacteria bacterium]